MIESYFDWLSSFAKLPDHVLLLRKLYLTDFSWLIPFDENRACDGIQLRYRFGRECGIPDPVICAELDNRPCSVLELIVALAIRIEGQIMGDESIGDRTASWIFAMITNLGLIGYNNHVFDEREVDRILYIFLNRQYSRTGRGGLFEIPNLDPSRDMRNEEIWCQMCWYLNEH